MNDPRDPIADRTGAARILGAAFGVLASHWSVPEVDIGAIEPDFAPLPALFAADSFIATMLGRQQTATPGLDAKGAAAFFIGEYANVLGIVVAAPYLTHALVPRLTPENCALAFAIQPDGKARVRLRLLDAACSKLALMTETTSENIHFTDREGLRARLRTELEAHMAPLIARLRACTGLPARAMWRLVSDSVAARFLEAGQVFGCADEAKAEALAILKAPSSPLANAQLHFIEIVIQDEASPRKVLARRSFRARGGCCRYYTAPGGSLCTSCVLQDSQERRRRLEAQMRSRLGLPATGDDPAGGPGDAEAFRNAAKALSPDMTAVPQHVGTPHRLHDTTKRSGEQSE